jgi:hypothetical protein
MNDCNTHEWFPMNAFCIAPSSTVLLIIVEWIQTGWEVNSKRMPLSLVNLSFTGQISVLELPGDKKIFLACQNPYFAESHMTPRPLLGKHWFRGLCFLFVEVVPSSRRMVALSIGINPPKKPNHTVKLKSHVYQGFRHCLCLILLTLESCNI